jgi:hypothetical protein
VEPQPRRLGAAARAAAADIIGFAGVVAGTPDFESR